MTKKKREIRLRGVRRGEPDLRKLSQALIALAQAQAEVEAEAGHRAVHVPKGPRPGGRAASAEESHS